jgi:hypothetical protein
VKILLVNQTFYPDRVATAQYLTDVAVTLKEAGHEVQVVAGRRGYDEPSLIFSKRENWRGIHIRRVWSVAGDKTRRWQRALSFASFLVSCASAMIVGGRPDAIVALTSPPLASVLGAAMARLWRARFVFWVMDLNPDEAVAAGWLREGSIATRVLQVFLRFSVRSADAVIALDSHMRDRLIAHGAAPASIHVIPPWSQDDAAYFDDAGRQAFRAEHGLAGKFVVMYAGNHSPCNPLGSIIESAVRLADRADILFCFVGGGSIHRQLRDEISRRGLTNVLLLPYQPRARLAATLSSADLQVATMGDAFVGVIHPSKIYNLLRVGQPTLYVGPATSHIEGLLRASQHQYWAVRHGDVDGVVNAILSAAGSPRAGRSASPLPVVPWSGASVIPRLVAAITGPEPARVADPLPAE